MILPDPQNFSNQTFDFKLNFPLEINLNFLIFSFPARQPRQMHQNLLDSHFTVPDVHPPTKKRREADPRRPDMQDHVLLRGQPRRVGKADDFARSLQERISKVSQALHRLRARHCQNQTNQVLTRHQFVCLFHLFHELCGQNLHMNVAEGL